MKKINANFNLQDRIINVQKMGKHELYYQPVGSNKRFFLFETNKAYFTAFDYFRTKGIRAANNDDSYSLTIRQLYDIKDRRNTRLINIIDRLPGMITYVIKEYIEEPDFLKQDAPASFKKSAPAKEQEDREFAA